MATDDRPDDDPAELIRAQYRRRKDPGRSHPEIGRLVRQEREDAAAAFLARLAPLAGRTLLEIGASQGRNISFFVGLGFRPEDIVLNDIRPEKLEAARSKLPFPVRTVAGDAAGLDLPQFDVVLAATVFTSILSDAHRRKVADTMWRLLRTGGGILLYDFTYDNPANPDVRRLTIPAVRDLFPRATLEYRRVTLAPPIARRIPPALYPLLNVRWLRTHVLCWLEKR